MYWNTLDPESRVFKLVEEVICFFNNLIELNDMAVVLSLRLSKEVFQKYVRDLNYCPTFMLLPGATQWNELWTQPKN